ncbi:hypothetical protein THAOC_26513, partial [Thalassiosira oceanica]
VFGRDYFKRPSAPEFEDEEMAAICSDVSQLDETRPHPRRRRGPQGAGHGLLQRQQACRRGPRRLRALLLQPCLG